LIERLLYTYLGVRGVETGLLVEVSGKVKENMELCLDRLGDTELRMRSKQGMSSLVM
jgi:hypothetical protein